MDFDVIILSFELLWSYRNAFLGEGSHSIKKKKMYFKQNTNTRKKLKN